MNEPTVIMSEIYVITYHVHQNVSICIFKPEWCTVQDHLKPLHVLYLIKIIQIKKKKISTYVVENLCKFVKLYMLNISKRLNDIFAW
jgi:hypothetical protein